MFAFDELGSRQPMNTSRANGRVQPEENLNSSKFLIHALSIAPLPSPTMSPVQTYLLRRTSRFALVAILLGFWFGGEQTCQGSCGDYLAHPGGQAQADGSDASHRMPAAPCRGANCSRRSETPPLPTRPTVETSSMEWACVLQQIRDQHIDSSEWSLESGKVLARHLSHQLKRPPRG
ncbi:hypothetical protein LBMAG52_33020 [Planctomycetia bacterium]|nr:hypothetical protein LBMAG52_33020 [Planctomycetia bacterium]